jgi:hypothetical protein
MHGLRARSSLACGLLSETLFFAAQLISMAMASGADWMHSSYSSTTRICAAHHDLCVLAHLIAFIHSRIQTIIHAFRYSLRHADTHPCLSSTVHSRLLIRAGINIANLEVVKNWSPVNTTVHIHERSRCAHHHVYALRNAFVTACEPRSVKVTATT